MSAESGSSRTTAKSAAGATSRRQQQRWPDRRDSTADPRHRRDQRTSGHSFRRHPPRARCHRRRIAAVGNGRLRDRGGSQFQELRHDRRVLRVPVLEAVGDRCIRRPVALGKPRRFGADAAGVRTADPGWCHVQRGDSRFEAAQRWQHPPLRGPAHRWNKPRSSSERRAGGYLRRRHTINLSAVGQPLHIEGISRRTAVSARPWTATSPRSWRCTAA